jgi:D-sedoheptulose 7-phosphate isomerase
MKKSVMISRIEQNLEESCRVKQRFSDELKGQIGELASKVTKALRAGKTVYWMGNGGSAADAQHLAAELVGKLRKPRRAFSSIALTTNSSTLTAVANDMAFNEIFSRQVEASIRAGDIVIGISTSGNSANVIRAVQTARKQKALTAGWTGQSGGKLAKAADLCLRVPSQDTQRIQEAHITMGHILCGLVEDMLSD